MRQSDTKFQKSVVGRTNVSVSTIRHPVAVDVEFENCRLQTSFGRDRPQNPIIGPLPCLMTVRRHVEALAEVGSGLTQREIDGDCLELGGGNAVRTVIKGQLGLFHFGKGSLPVAGFRYHETEADQQVL